jgi:uncharacterized OB-fold protein
MSALPPIEYRLEYPYTRTTGPVVGAFLTGLRDGRLLGIRCRDRVLCPPLEYDPETGETLAPDFVEVGPGGTILSWTWIAEPSRKHPFAEPFAFALIRPDGSDTALCHAVRASGPEALRSGGRVRAQYREERRGAITDLFFAPETEAAAQYVPPGKGVVEMTEHLISLDFSEPLAPHRERFARGLLAGKFIGQRSPASGKVYLPSKGYDPIERVRMSERDDVVVSDVGTVVAYTVITPVQYYGQKETEPYIRASILLDGADQPLGQQDVKTIPIAEFRTGLRLRAVWKPPAERSLEGVDNRWGGTGAAIERWEPTGEPDVPFERIRDHNW